MTTFNEADFDAQPLRCTDCRWQGRGEETKLIDLYGVSANQEVRCPDCDALLGALPRQRGSAGDSRSDLGFIIG